MNNDSVEARVEMISLLFGLKEDSQSDREETQGQDEQLHRWAGFISAYVQH